MASFTLGQADSLKVPWASSSGTLHTSRSYTYQLPEVDSIGSCRRLFHTLISTGLRGPQLFRLKTEFELLPASKHAGQSRIFRAQDRVVADIKKATSRIPLEWSIGSVVIKQHLPKDLPRDGGASNQGSSSSKLGRHFLAAHREILAFSSHPDIQRHPNIVQLLGWGFCLDTIENPDQQNALQVPLLVLERADGDLKDFLQSYPDLPPDILIGLCKDVGNGLEVLHKNHFTHGDLKPQNILVFRENKEWTAKLCDFGCARQDSYDFKAQPEDSDNQPPRSDTDMEAKYAGTLYWRPPEVVDRTLRIYNHEALRLCDIYVYGLIIWSVLCKKGDTLGNRKGDNCLASGGSEHKSPDVALEGALSDLENQTPKADWHDMVVTVLRSCLCEPGGRSPKPWNEFPRTSFSTKPLRWLQCRDALYSNMKQVTWKSVGGILRSSTTFLERTRSGGAPSRQQLWLSSICDPLQPEDKAEYENLNCWERSRRNLPAQLVQGSRPLLQPPPTDLAFEDRDCHSLSSFHRVFLSDEIQTVYNEILRSLGNTNIDQRLKAYTWARFRSRIPAEQWQVGLGDNRQNLLAAALRAIPSPDINTVAWLCRGQIGYEEVQSLPPSTRIWHTMLDANMSNESERLERFLLLLQFGARVERQMPPSKTWNDPEQRSIIFEYIRSCRRAIVGTVMREICLLVELQNSKNLAIPEETLLYLTGKAETTTAFEDFVAAIDYDAVRELHKRGFFPRRQPGSAVLDGLRAVSSGRGVHKQEYRRGANQILGLLNGPTFLSMHPRGGETQNLPPEPEEAHSLPSGWDDISFIIRGGLSGSNRRVELYRDVTTRSITLKRPTKPFVAGTKICVGWQNTKLHKKDFLFVDINIFFGPQRSVQSKEVFKKRFPLFTDDWFKQEQYHLTPAEDILASLTDPWTLPSFGDNLDISWLSYFLSLFLNVLSTSWLTLAVYGLRLVPLIFVVLRAGKHGREDQS